MPSTDWSQVRVNYPGAKMFCITQEDPHKATKEGAEVKHLTWHTKTAY